MQSDTGLSISDPSLPVSPEASSDLFVSAGSSSPENPFGQTNTEQILICGHRRAQVSPATDTAPQGLATVTLIAKPSVISLTLAFVPRIRQFANAI